jgi:hypothetical protein
MSEPQYYFANISVSKNFLIQTHAHPLLAEIKELRVDDGFYLRMWESSSDPHITTFGGVFGVQFKSSAEIESFAEALKSVLTKHKIGEEHADNLLYFMKFYGEDVEKESLANNEYNRLIEYTHFILDLQKNAEAHALRYSKDKHYKRVDDPYTKEYFFARTTLFDKYTLDEIIEDRPQENPGDIVSYLRFNIGITELYVPYDVVFTLTSHDKLKNFDGETVDQFNLPRYLQSELLNFTLSYMLNAHKVNNTPFYKTITRAPLSADDFRKLYRQYQRKVIKQNSSILRIGSVITDYLINQNLIKSKRSIASFLFEYFALFKVLRIKKPKSFPEDYSKLSRFYIENGITSETIRLMMKEVSEVGEI